MSSKFIWELGDVKIIPSSKPGLPLAELQKGLRRCLHEPIPQVMDAARYLDAAATAHLASNSVLAEHLFRLADIPEVREWTESIWGKRSPHLKLQATRVFSSSSTPRVKQRMPSTSDKRILHLRDGYHCRFCSIPVIRKEVREALRISYQGAIPWGSTNGSQHAAFQAMWAQYDHVIPHALGGDSSLDNLVVTCAPCNFGRMNHSLEEVSISDPRKRAPLSSHWDGLERVLAK